MEDDDPTESSNMGRRRVTTRTGGRVSTRPPKRRVRDEEKQSAGVPIARVPARFQLINQPWGRRPLRGPSRGGRNYIDRLARMTETNRKAIYLAGRYQRLHRGRMDHVPTITSAQRKYNWLMRHMKRRRRRRLKRRRPWITKYGRRRRYKSRFKRPWMKKRRKFYRR
ncbi:hypothetical protein [Crucivirus-482]|nr:hypothetical protein [Crucivirus-482]